MKFSPGCLVKVRERDWVVLPNDDPELLLLKPLGGSEEEITGIYLPLNLAGDQPRSTDFPLPAAADLGNLQSARLLHDAARLSFRNGAGPFRALAKLSFRPRAYQMVPLVMALRQDQVRLLIADDVGVGKTIEALLIVRELLERRVIRRFAVICLPHLCDQWQEEISRKLDIEAVVIRSSTQARLDREIQGDTSVFEHYPYQILSVDYIKSESRRATFISQCPELIIVDEVHACACPAGAAPSQQQRHALLRDIAARENQHLVLLTATPHSGKPEEFQSLLGLLKPEFALVDLASFVPETRRREIAAHFIQRRRADVQQWASEHTSFPEREQKEIRYEPGQAQNLIFDEIMDFARGLVTADTAGRRRRVSYWTALALLRGVASSPAAGAAMLRTRLEHLAGDEPQGPSADPATENDNACPVHDCDPARESAFESDILPVELMQELSWSEHQKRRLSELAGKLEAIATPAKDEKLAAAGRLLEDNLKAGFNTVVFCRYLATAAYLGQHLGRILGKRFPKLCIEVITSEDPDDLRRKRIEAMGDPTVKHRVLIATDCLSEGINLHELFTAVLHYDLPWNPNRLEQREGRVDRFGQTAPLVRAALLYGENPVDAIVLDVILKKIREIRRSTGISIVFPEDSRSILDAIAQAVLFSPGRAVKAADSRQLELDLGEYGEARQNKERISQELEKAERREKLSRSIFAQHSIKADELENDLREADEFIGGPAAVQEFVAHALAVLGVELTPVGGRTTEGSVPTADSAAGGAKVMPGAGAGSAPAGARGRAQPSGMVAPKGFRLHTGNLPESLKLLLPAPGAASLLVSFTSPTPAGHLYLGRNHPFVEQLCHLIMRNSLEHNHRHGASRAAVIRSAQVREKHTIYLCRCRNVIARHGDDAARLVAEEMLLWGYRGFHKDNQFLSHADARQILIETGATANLEPAQAAAFLVSETDEVVPALKPAMDQAALIRGQQLVDAHHRFSRLMKERARYQTVEPVLPMDILGVYIVLPEVK